MVQLPILSCHSLPACVALKYLKEIEFILLLIFKEYFLIISSCEYMFLSYISNKQFVSEGNFYLSESSAKRLDKTNNFVYDKISKSEIESLYLYVKK